MRIGIILMSIISTLLGINQVRCQENVMEIVHNGPKGVEKIDLRNGRSKLLLNNQNLIINSIERLADEKYLISYSSLLFPERGNKVSVLSESGLVDLFPGEYATHIPGSDKILYFSEHGKLTLRGVTGNKKEIFVVDENTQFSPRNILKTSDYEFVYSSQRNGEQQTLRYNWKTNEYSPLVFLNKCNFSRAVYINGWFFCSNLRGDTFYLISEENGEEKEIDLSLRETIPRGVLEYHNLIVLQNYTFSWNPFKFGETSNVWVYDIQSRKQKILIKNIWYPFSVWMTGEIGDVFP